MRTAFRTFLGLVLAAFGERVKDSAEEDRLHAEKLLRKAARMAEMGERLSRQASMVLELSDIVVVECVVDTANEPDLEEEEDEEAVH